MPDLPRPAHPAAAHLDRRTLLRTFAGSAFAGAVALRSRASLAEPATAPISRERMTPTELKRGLVGPVLSIPTPFTKDLAIDFDGVKNMITRGAPHGIRIISLTGGNSQYDVLTYDEIVELTRFIVEAAGPQAITIAAAGDWPLEKTLDYAETARKAGATALQVMNPGTNALAGGQQAAADTEDLEPIVEHFRKVAAGTPLPLILHGQFSHPLLERLATIDAIAAMKEDVGLEYYIQIQRKFGERFAIFEGGPEYAYLVAYPYGSKASYTTLGTFAPQLTAQFWKAVNAGDVKAAYDYVKTYELPFFDHWSHAFWRASLEHFGVAHRYLRPPQAAFTDAEMKTVADFYATWKIG
jgi:dihydrodipicolinate synthase/N-acetylneuraminate lyase